MARRLVAVVTGACLFAASLAAPMTHVHDDDHHAGPHHSGRIIHTHMGGHGAMAARPVNGAALEGPADHRGERARALNTFQVVANSSVADVALAVAVFTLTPPLVRRGAIARVPPRSHDPPFTRSLRSRAPPALPS